MPSHDNWAGWFSGALLAALPLLYFWAHGRLMAVSGRYTLFVNHLRYGNVDEADSEASEQELIEAMQAASLEVFGEEAVVSELPEPRPPSVAPPPRRKYAISAAGHALFLLGLVLGGLITGGGVLPEWSLGDGVWGARLSEGQLPWVLGLGGVLVGFGTRMCGGCTVGHGLCGLPRLERGSLLSTLAFFGGGVVTTFLIAAL